MTTEIDPFLRNKPFLNDHCIVSHVWKSAGKLELSHSRLRKLPFQNMSSRSVIKIILSKQLLCVLNC